MAKINKITDVAKTVPKETPAMLFQKVDYEGDTNQKTHGSDDSPSETDGCVRNLVKKHESQEDEEFKEYTSEINNTNESKLSKNKQKNLS